jgi:(E)-2-((N-methylformamido)methylene)succinate hydrolase
MLKTLQRSRTRRGAAFLEAGDGEVLLLLHGVGLRLEAWEPQIEEFGKSFRVVAPDLPGHGESRPLDPGAGLEAFVEWAFGLMDDLAIPQANVAGHSMGALIAGGMAATAPERILRVALLSAVYRRTPEARAAVLARAGQIARGDIDRDAPLARWFAPGERATSAFSRTRGWLSDVDRRGYATAYSAFATGDDVYADAWRDIACPALFLTGSDDPNSTPAMACAMAQAAPAGSVRLVEGHRHMVNLTAADEVNASLRDWLARERTPSA